jgi:dTDP-4-amino-4,6-dideoxygalactose transaminase
VRIDPPPAWPVFEQDEISAVVQVLRSGKVNQWTGALVGEFEVAFAQYIGMPHGVAVTNGSVALEVALRALGIGRGDEVIVTSRSFIASASCVDMVGASPVFADVEYDTGLISPATIEPHIGPKTKAVIPVHLYGRPCDMSGIMRLARDHGLLVIEDCAQSHGASIDGRLTGSFGDAAAFSFCQDKIITTGGEGGMVLFSREDARDRAWAFKDHGKCPRSVREKTDGLSFRWLHGSVGTNGRMMELQAAIGLRQLAKLESRVRERGRIAGRLFRAVSPYPCVRVVPPAPGHRHAYYRFDFIFVPERAAPGWTRDRLVEELTAEGIRAFAGACPEIYLEDAYKQRFGLERRPNAALLGKTSVAMLAHNTLDEEYVSDCEKAIATVLARASGRSVHASLPPANKVSAVD